MRALGGGRRWSPELLTPANPRYPTCRYSVDSFQDEGDKQMKAKLDKV